MVEGRKLVEATVAGLLAVAVAVWLRALPVTSDPWHYVRAGLHFPSHSWNLVGLTRYGLVLPEALVTRVTGFSTPAFYVLPVLATGLLVGAVYWLARRSFGLVAAVTCAVLLLADSVVLQYASRLYPDVPAAAVTALAVALATGSRDAWQRQRRVGARLWLLVVLTGAAVGASWWMRETAVFAWPVVAAVLLWRGGPPLRVVLPGAGAASASFLAAEAALSRWAYGDPWARFHALLGGGLATSANLADRAYVGQTRLAYLEAVPRGVLAYADGRWVLAMAALALLGGVLFPRRVGLFSGWFVLVLAGYLAAGGLLRPHAPSIRLDDPRYWLAFLVPMVPAAVGTVACAARAAATLVPGSARRPSYLGVVGVVLALALAVGPVLASVRQVRGDPEFLVTNHGVVSRFVGWLEAHRHQVRRVVTDRASARLLGVSTRAFGGRRLVDVRFVPFARPTEARPGDYLVLFSAHTDVCVFCRAREESWLAGPAKRLRHAVPVWRTADGAFDVYRLVPPNHRRASAQ